MSKQLHPLLYQINTRVWLTELSHVAGRATTLDDIQDAELDLIGQAGIRLDLAPQRLADRFGGAAGFRVRTSNGGGSLKRHCRI